jgi:hypothetical protein
MNASKGAGFVVSQALEEIELGLERDVRLFADQGENSLGV